MRKVVDFGKCLRGGIVLFFSFFLFFFGWTYPCECTGDDGCATEGYRVGGDHHQTEEAASDGHCCWEEVVWRWMFR